MMYGMPLSPAQVARVLSRAKVRYVLVGAHALNLYTGKPRATQDVDIITDGPAKARRAISMGFPELAAVDHPVVIRFKLDGKEILDVIKAGTNKLFRRVMKLTSIVSMDGQSVIVPRVEAALALKFQSMMNPARRTTDRMQDAVDFARAAEMHKKLDLELLEELGDVAFPGGGSFLLKLIADAQAGRRLEI